MSPESFFKEYNVFHIIAINERDESSCIVTVDPSLVGRDHIDVALNAPKEKLEELRVLEVSEQARTSAQRFLKAFQKDSCDKIEKALIESCKKPAPFSVGDRVQITSGFNRGMFGIVGEVDMYLTVRSESVSGSYLGRFPFSQVRLLPWKLKENVSGLIRIVNSDGRFVLTSPEAAQDICNQLNKL